MKLNLHRCPLLLAILLQTSPLWRTVTTGIGLPAGSGIAFLRQFLLLGGIVGSIDALSGATGPSITPKTYSGKVGKQANFTVEIQNDFSYIIDQVKWAPILPPGQLPPGLGLVSNQISFDPVIISASIRGKPTQAGTYQVLVTIGDSSSVDFSTSATLTLQIAPPDLPATIVSGPTDQTVTQGSDTEFAVVVSGSTPISYQWYFDGNKRLDGATNSTLVLPHVPLTAAGTYSVAVTNSFGGQMSSPARLTVNPPVIVPPFAITSVRTAGGQFQFEFPTVPGPSYQVQFVPVLGKSNWLTVSNFPPATHIGTAQFVTPLSGTRGWYRVVSVP